MDIESERKKLRFSGKFKVMPSGCWEWQYGSFHKPNGDYGMFYWGLENGKEKTITAHRASWLIFRGPIPKNRKEEGCVLHKCNNPPCVNPDHLYIGTHKDNARDRDEAGRTSRWDKRYNFKRSQTLIDQIKALLPSGKSLQTICDELGIGWQTMYRARDQDEELKRMIKETKSDRYSNANRQRKN